VTIGGGLARTAEIVSMEPVLIKRQAPRTFSDDGCIGATLREAREADALSLDDAADFLKIKRLHLSAIEEGQFDRLPGRVFAEGFVKAYAKHLRFDPEEALRKLRVETRWGEEPREPAAPAARNLPPVNEARDARSMWPVLVVLVFVLLCGWHITRPASVDGVVETGGFPQPSERRSRAAPIAPMGPTPAIIAASTRTEGGAATPTRAPTGEPELRAVDETDAIESLADAGDGGLAEARMVRPTDARAAPSATPDAPELESVFDRPALGAPPPLPAGRRLGADPANARVRIRAIVPGLLRIEDPDGAVVFAETLRTGDVYFVPAGRELRMTALNASGFDLIADGAYRGPAGEPGEILRGLALNR